jgi:hypothetical protein
LNTSIRVEFYSHIHQPHIRQAEESAPHVTVTTIGLTTFVWRFGHLLAETTLFV